jgi:hypothetical protein
MGIESKRTETRVYVSKLKKGERRNLDEQEGNITKGCYEGLTPP